MKLLIPMPIKPLLKFNATTKTILRRLSTDACEPETSLPLGIETSAESDASPASETSWPANAEPEI